MEQATGLHPSGKNILLFTVCWPLSRCTFCQGWGVGRGDRKVGRGATGCVAAVSHRAGVAVVLFMSSEAAPTEPNEASTCPGKARCARQTCLKRLNTPFTAPDSYTFYCTWTVTELHKARDFIVSFMSYV